MEHILKYGEARFKACLTAAERSGLELEIEDILRLLAQPQQEVMELISKSPPRRDEPKAKNL